MSHMNRSVLRLILSVIVLLLTFAAFAYYISSHPAVRQQLQQTSFTLIVGLLLLYLVGIVALAGVTLATLRLCKIRIPVEESILLTAYSAVINFFGPLQSGPAFRAAYLKAKHNVNLKHYAAATLVYYFFYGGLSGLMLLSGILHWWLILILGAFGIITRRVLRQSRMQRRLQGVDLHGWYYLALATGAQLLIVLIIYYLELMAIVPGGIHFSQAITYTGAANLSLFVSITPGAIGFRESFLLFSQNLHDISNASIVAASVLDRAMYILLLLILAVFIVVTNTRSRLNVKESHQ